MTERVRPNPGVRHALSLCKAGPARRPVLLECDGDLAAIPTQWSRFIGMPISLMSFHFGVRHAPAQRPSAPRGHGRRIGRPEPGPVAARTTDASDPPRLRFEWIHHAGIAVHLPRPHADGWPAHGPGGTGFRPSVGFLLQHRPEQHLVVYGSECGPRQRPGLPRLAGCRRRAALQGEPGEFRQRGAGSLRRLQVGLCQGLDAGCGPLPLPLPRHLRKPRRLPEPRHDRGLPGPELQLGQPEIFPGHQRQQFRRLQRRGLRLCRPQRVGAPG